MNIITQYHINIIIIKQLILRIIFFIPNKSKAKHKAIPIIKPMIPYFVNMPFKIKSPPKILSILLTNIKKQYKLKPINIIVIFYKYFLV